MQWSFSIGRLFGSQLKVHATFFLLLLWIGGAAYVAHGPQAAVQNLAFILALFVCVIAHEFGHALMARRYGIKTPDITLLPIGGMARLERMPEKPSEEIAVALAGPAVNVVIWAVLALFLGATGVGALAQLNSGATLGAGNFLAQLAAINLFLAGFNMIPAFPMDGGRVFRAFMAMFMPREKATRIAAGAGQALAFAFGFWGLMGGNVILILIAIFIFMAAAAESNDVQMTSAAKVLKARDAMITSYESLGPDDTMQIASAALIRTTQHEFPVLAPDGTLQGFLTRNAIFHAVAHGQTAMQVSKAMATDIPKVQLGGPLDEVLRALHGKTPAVAVTDKGGNMLGYVTRENLGELMVMRAHR